MPESDTPTSTNNSNAVDSARSFVQQRDDEPRELPTVMVPRDGLTVSASAERLFSAVAESRRIFYRGGLVVELVNEGNEYITQPLVAAAAVTRFEKYVRFMKQGKGNAAPTPTNITEQTAKLYLKCEAARNCLPKLNGIVHCPMLVEKDGQLIEVNQGYNADTGLYVTSARPAVTVDLEFAVGLLARILDGFDFVTLGDRSRAIASLITPALKLGGFIRGPVPIDVAEANASQSGKTYRQKMIAAIYNQKLAVVTKKTGGGVGGMEESFCEHLIKGRVFIQFDNVRGKLDSQYLEAFLTADGPFLARVPNLAPMNVDPSKFILFISSNGFEATKDLANRASIIGIRKREHHQFQRPEGMDLIEFITTKIQPDLIGSVFAVIREWHARGKPRTSETAHDFREWCGTLDWILQNIFHAAPLMTDHNEAKRRAANPSLTFLRALAIKLNDRNAMGQALSASDISQICLEEDIDIPGVKMEEQTLEQGPQQIGKMMKPLFKDAEEITFGEFKVVRTSQQNISQAGHSFDAYRYSFTMPGIDENPTPHEEPEFDDDPSPPEQESEEIP
jgi:hypothetical protein